MEFIDEERLLPELWEEVVDGVDADFGKLTRREERITIHAAMEALLILGLAHQNCLGSPWTNGWMASRELDSLLDKYFNPRLYD